MSNTTKATVWGGLLLAACLMLGGAELWLQSQMPKPVYDETHLTVEQELFRKDLLNRHRVEVFTSRGGHYIYLVQERSCLDCGWQPAQAVLERPTWAQDDGSVVLTAAEQKLVALAAKMEPPRWMVWLERPLYTALDIQSQIAVFQVAIALFSVVGCITAVSMANSHKHPVTWWLAVAASGVVPEVFFGGPAEYGWLNLSPWMFTLPVMLAFATLGGCVFGLVRSLKRDLGKKCGIHELKPAT